MPTYAYRCPDGHKAERIFTMSSKPDGIPCPECDEQMKQVPNWSPSPRPHRYGTNKFTHTKSEDPVRLRHYVCPDGHDTDEWFDEAPDSIPCQEEGCDLVAKKSVGAQIETFWLSMEREGGYYDQSLGMRIYTEAQRKREAEKRGLTIVDGDFDIQQATFEGRQKQQKLQDGYRDYHDRVQHDPAYADARAAIARGELPELIDPNTAF